MITIPFSWFGFTDWILSQNEPAIIIMFATFGTLFSLIVIMPLMSLCGLKKYAGYVALALLCSVFISMIVMIPSLLLFSLENATKLLLIWMIIVASCLIFSLANQQYLDMLLNSAKEKNHKKLDEQMAKSAKKRNKRKK